MAHLGWLGCVMITALVTAAEPRGIQFIGWDKFDQWSRTAGAAPGETVLTSPEIAPGIAWDELVASWNAEAPAGTGLRLEARARREGHTTKFYLLGRWADDSSKAPRESVRQQQDQDGDVSTDTLVLKQPTDRVQLRITLMEPPGTGQIKLKFVGLSVLNSQANPGLLAPNRSAWGKCIAVPERSQASYPGGAEAWCSPTCVSMMLAYWARELKRPELDRDVPEVVKGVFDSQWPGTGNWPFNTAYAGSLPGLRAYVARLSDVSEIEDWIARGIPVVTSVSYDLLRGRPRTRDSGHLVVVVGFTETGDVIANDPGTRLNVRKTFLRKDLIAAWANSRNAVYLIYPENRPPPADRFGHWHTP